MATNNMAGWSLGPLSHQSMLSRPRRKDGRETEGADEVRRSPATERHIQTFFDALRLDDRAEQGHALADIVKSWRADNNAGGLPVYAHLPLPNAFANALAQVVQNDPDEKSAAESLAARLQPGARLSVFQQLSVTANNQVRDALPSRSGSRTTSAPEEPPSDRRRPEKPQPAVPRNDPQPRWERTPVEGAPGIYNFRMRTPHEGWFINDMTGKKFYYNPDTDIIIDAAPDQDNDGRPDGLQIEPWRGY